MTCPEQLASAETALGLIVIAFLLVVVGSAIMFFSKR